MINDLNEEEGISIDSLFSRGKEILLNFEYDLAINGNQAN